MAGLKKPIQDHILRVQPVLELHQGEFLFSNLLFLLKSRLLELKEGFVHFFHPVCRMRSKFYDV